MMFLTSISSPSIFYSLVILGVSLLLVYSVHVSFWLTDVLPAYNIVLVLLLGVRLVFGMHLSVSCIHSEGDTIWLLLFGFFLELLYHSLGD